MSTYEQTNADTPTQYWGCVPSIDEMNAEQLRLLLKKTSKELFDSRQELASAMVENAKPVAQKPTGPVQHDQILGDSSFESTINGLAILDDGGNLLSSNQEFFEVFELDQKQTGNFIEHLQSNYTVGGKPASVSNCLNQLENCCSMTKRLVKATTHGQSGFLEVTFSRLDLEHETARFMVNAVDISQQKVLQDRDQLMSSLFLNLQEGVLILGLDGMVCEANPVFCRSLGLEREQIVGRPVSQITDWEDQKLPALLAGSIRGESQTARVRLVHPSDPHSKDIYLGTLSPALNADGKATNLLAVFTNITDIERTQNRLHRQALHDSLTGLPNRRYFADFLEKLIESKPGKENRFSVCFLDLDDFKIVNDTLGHEAGDQLLIQVAERIKKCVYRDCFISRFGGDEFGLIIPENGDPKRIAKIAREVVNKLNQPFEVDNSRVFVGVSIGLTQYPSDADDSHTLLRHADVAMYEAKDSGKNTVRGFTPMLAAKIQANQELLYDLRVAVAQEEIDLAYQPKWCLKTEQLAGCEALVRWTRNGELAHTGALIDAAEKSGLILPMGDQVLVKAMTQAMKWKAEGIIQSTMAINLSPRQLADRDFVGRFEQMLKQHKIDPKLIELEITENAMVDNTDVSISRLEHLKSMGVRIAIDDFGTGYSSLNYLKTFPVSTLKIDIAFVRDLPHDHKAVAVAKTVLSLGHGLNLQVVAEGVETEEQKAFLKEAGCDTAQGYLIGKPMYAEQFKEWASDLPKRKASTKIKP